MVESLTPDQGAAGSSITSVTALCPLARHINPSLVLVQPRKTRPYITERLLMGRKESNQTNILRVKNHRIILFFCSFSLKVVEVCFNKLLLTYIYIHPLMVHPFLNEYQNRFEMISTDCHQYMIPIAFQALFLQKWFLHDLLFACLTWFRLMLFMRC